MQASDSSPERFARSLVELRPNEFDLVAGIRGAAIFLVPLAVGFLVGNPPAGVLAALGTLNLLLTEAPRPTRTRGRILWVSAGVSGVTFGVGSLLPLLPPGVEIPLVAATVFVVLFLTGTGEWQNAGLTAAVMLVVGVGLAPAHFSVPGTGALLVLLGGLWGVVGIFASRRLGYEDTRPRGAPANSVETAATRSGLAAHAAVVGVTVAVGLAVGLALGLPRDFWIMLTILVALRLDLATTSSYTGMRILGTIAGASLAYVVTVYVQEILALFVILAGAAVLAFSSRTVNYTVYAVWITLLVITLLDLAYAGGPALALTRVVDTLIGGALALLAAFLLASAVHGRPTRRAAALHP